MYEYYVNDVRVVDADTFHVNVDLGCDVSVWLTVRLDGLTTETRAALDEVDADFVKAWFDAAAAPVKIFTHRDQREKYGRFTAQFTNGEGGLSEALNERQAAGL